MIGWKYFCKRVQMKFPVMDDETLKRVTSYLHLMGEVCLIFCFSKLMIKLVLCYVLMKRILLQNSELKLSQRITWYILSNFFMYISQNNITLYPIEELPSALV